MLYDRLSAREVPVSGTARSNRVIKPKLTLVDTNTSLANRNVCALIVGRAEDKRFRGRWAARGGPATSTNNARWD